MSAPPRGHLRNALAPTWLGVLVFCLSGTTQAAAEELPVFTRLDVTGGFARVDQPISPTRFEQAFVPRSPIARANADTLGETFRLPAQATINIRPDDDEDDDEDFRPSQPGTLSRSFVKLPSPTPSLQTRSLGPHLTPTATFDITDRAAVGVIVPSDFDKAKLVTGAIPISAYRNAATKAVTTHAAQKGRDNGFGLTWEYRFGK